RPKDVIHHSDQGSQYTSVAFGKRCGEAGFAHRWGRSVMPTTTPWPRASSPPSRRNCSAAAGLHRRPKPGWPASATSRAGTIRRVIQAPEPEPRIMRYELTDHEWTAIKPFLPNKPRGVPRVNDRRVLNGILWLLRSGAPWRDLPDNFGPYTTCYNRFVRWRRA